VLRQNDAMNKASDSQMRNPGSISVQSFRMSTEFVHPTLLQFIQLDECVVTNESYELFYMYSLRAIIATWLNTSPR